MNQITVEPRKHESACRHHALSQALTAVEPGESAIDDPSPRQDDKAAGDTEAFDDFDLHPREVSSSTLREPGSLVSAVGKNFVEERKHPEQVDSNSTPPSRS